MAERDRWAGIISALSGLVGSVDATLKFLTLGIVVVGVLVALDLVFDAFSPESERLFSVLVGVIIVVAYILGAFVFG